jgi:hypothetical protein
LYPTYKSQLDTFIASIKADVATCKIAICLPPIQLGGRGDYFTGKYDNKDRKGGLSKLSSLLIKDYDAREAESLYVLATGMQIDPVYGFGTISQVVPFEGYGGSERVVKQSDTIHLDQGVSKFAIAMSAWIQHTR